MKDYIENVKKLDGDFHLWDTLEEQNYLD